MREHPEQPESPITFVSLFAGIAGFDAGFEAAGMECVAQVEIEADCRSVLRRHFPKVPQGDDVRYAGHRSTLLRRAANVRRDQQPTPVTSREALDKARRNTLEPALVLCGGSPCQSFSVAGLRKGLDDERGNLMFQFCRVADELRPDIIVWENVPGVLSSKDNAFGCLLAALVGESAALQPTGGRWTNAGVVAGPERTAAWRVLDAQYFGVAQRRRRVFVVASAGSVCPAEILFEPEGVPRHLAPRREKGQGVASRPQTGSGVSSVDLQNTRLGGDLAGTVDTTRPSRGGGQAVMVAANNFGERDISTSLSASNERIDGDTETFVVAYNVHSENSTAMQGNGDAAVAFETDTARNLDTCGGYATGQGGTVVSFNWQGGGTQTTLGADTEKTGCLQVGQVPAVAFTEVEPCVVSRDSVPKTANNLVTDLRAGNPHMSAINHGFGVRRLMPVECERLQGFKDGHTEFGIDEQGERVPMSDSARYRQLGNAVCRNVGEWIGRRIVMQWRAAA